MMMVMIFVSGAVFATVGMCFVAAVAKARSGHRDDLHR